MELKDKFVLHVFGEFLIVLGGVLVALTWIQDDKNILEVLLGIFSVVVGGTMQWFSSK